MNIKIVDTLTEAQILELAALYKEEAWTRDRNIEDIKTMVTHCTIIGLIDEDADKLVGFTRMLTDCMYRANIYDVIVLKEYHGQGLGRILMETIVSHSLLKNVERVHLYCAEDMISFYNKWGFFKVSNVTNFLSRTNL